jgi:hypothetical protein
VLSGIWAAIVSARGFAAYRGKALIFWLRESPIGYRGFVTERSALPKNSRAPRRNASGIRVAEFQLDMLAASCDAQSPAHNL